MAWNMVLKTASSRREYDSFDFYNKKKEIEGEVIGF